MNESTAPTKDDLTRAEQIAIDSVARFWKHQDNEVNGCRCTECKTIEKRFEFIRNNGDLRTSLCFIVDGARIGHPPIEEMDAIIRSMEHDPLQGSSHSNQ